MLQCFRLIQGAWLMKHKGLNTLRLRQNGRHFADDIFKWIFLNENIWISIKISLKFVSKGPFNNNPALVQIMAWCRPGDKPLSEPMMVSLTMHICVTRPQWVNKKANILQMTFSNSFFSFLNIFFIFNKITIKYVPLGLMDNKVVLVQVMTWYLTGNRPLPYLPEPLLT